MWGRCLTKGAYASYVGFCLTTTILKKTHLQKGVTIGYGNSDGPGEMWKIAKKIASWDWEPALELDLDWLDQSDKKICDVSTGRAMHASYVARSFGCVYSSGNAWLTVRVPHL